MKMMRGGTRSNWIFIIIELDGITVKEKRIAIAIEFVNTSD
jgi:hypothetical protein